MLVGVIRNGNRDVGLYRNLSLVGMLAYINTQHS